MINTQFALEGRSVPTTRDPLEFGQAAARMIERLDGPEKTQLLADPDGGIIYSAPGSSDGDRDSAAVSFASTLLGGESADVVNADSFDNMVTMEGLSSVLADPALAAQIQSLSVKIDHLSSEIQRIVDENGGQLTPEQEQTVGRLTDEMNPLSDLRVSLTQQQREIVSSRSADIASIDGNPQLSASELASYIHTMDQNGDGVVSNTEERFDVVRKGAPPNGL